MGAIYGVKQGKPLEAPRRLIQEAAAHLQYLGAEVVVAGCTEVPLILQDGELSVPVVDSARILAEAAVRRALGQTHH
jgi:aspartate racemase